MGLRGSGAGLGGDGGLDACRLAADDADACGVGELAGGLLETEIESLLLEVAQADAEFVLGEIVGVFGFGHGANGLKCVSGVRVAHHEAGADTEFVGGETHGLAGGGFRDAGDLKEDVAGTDHGDPGIDGTLAFTHPGFWRA